MTMDRSRQRMLPVRRALPPTVGGLAIGRMPGWIAHWKEVRDSGSRIYRPRRVYTGREAMDYIDMNWR